MQKLIIFYFIWSVLLGSVWTQAAEMPQRGLFVSVIQNPPVLYSRQDILKLIDYAQKARVGILFVQIYRSNMSWFPSIVGDSTPYEVALKNVHEDSFAFLIKEAHKKGIEVHAWINMLSLGENQNAKLLKQYGPEILTQNIKPKKNLDEYKIDDQYFLEPGDPRVRAELTKIVEEIVQTYSDLDGIQFDYVRYPDAKPYYGHSKMNIERFRKATGLNSFEDQNPVWQNWKREQVTELLKQMAKQARSLRPGIKISATGCMPYVRAYYEAYQDWPSWVNNGIVDFVTLMNYSTNVKEYARWIVNARGKVKDFRKIYIGLGSYKSSGSREVFVQESKICKKAGLGACVVFHYGSLLQNSPCSNFFVNEK